MKRRAEYRRFTELADKILSVPHAEIKAKLDAEKEAKRVAKKQKATHHRGA